MQTTIYLIRHGEVYNPHNILYGRLPNYKLSQHGIKEIQASANFLKDKPITAIYSSPILRARQTAQIIQKKLHLPNIFITKHSIEVNTSYQGKFFSDLDDQQSEVYLKPLNSTDETVEQLAYRMEKLIKSLVKKYPGKQIVLVSHGDVIMSLQAKIKGLPLIFPSVRAGEGRIYTQHGEVLQITVDGKDTTIKSVFKPNETI